MLDWTAGNRTRVVSHYWYRHPLLLVQPPEHCYHLGPANRVQVAGWLIGQEQVGFVGQEVLNVWCVLGELGRPISRHLWESLPGPIIAHFQ